MYIIQTNHPFYGWNLYYRADHIWSSIPDQAIVFDNLKEAQRFVERHGVDESIWNVTIAKREDEASHTAA